jgi:hypothetical protein
MSLLPTEPNQQPKHPVYDELIHHDHPVFQGQGYQNARAEKQPSDEQSLMYQEARNSMNARAEKQ